MIMPKSIVLQQAAVGVHMEGNSDVCVMVQEFDIGAGAMDVVDTRADLYHREDVCLFMQKVVCVAGQASPPPSMTCLAAGDHGGDHGGDLSQWIPSTVDACVQGWTPAAAISLQAGSTYAVDNRTSTSSVTVLVFLLCVRRQLVAAGGLPEALPVGLSNDQRSGPHGTLCLHLARVFLTDGTSVACTDPVALRALDTVIEEVRWTAGDARSVSFGPYLRFSVTDALTACVQCGLVGRVQDGHCFMNIRTLHVGRIADVAGLFIE
jgi:hypothetical protein